MMKRGWAASRNAAHGCSDVPACAQRTMAGPTANDMKRRNSARRGQQAAHRGLLGAFLPIRVCGALKSVGVVKTDCCAQHGALSSFLVVKRTGPAEVFLRLCPSSSSSEHHEQGNACQQQHRRNNSKDDGPNGRLLVIAAAASTPARAISPRRATSQDCRIKAWRRISVTPRVLSPDTRNGEGVIHKRARGHAPGHG